MKTRGEKWANEEITLLKELYSKGLKIDDIVNKVNHSNSAISHKLKEINLTSRRGNWTEEELTKLKELFEKGLTYPEIAKQLNKSVRACQAKAIRIGLKTKECNVWKDKSREDFWTPEDYILLANGIDDGLSRKELAQKLGKTEKSINCKMTESGLFLKEKSLLQESEYRRVFSVNDNYFENINSQKKAYWLGWMITDGYVISVLHTNRGITASSKVGLKLQSSDKYVLEDFTKDTESTFPLKYVKARTNVKPYKNKITGKERIISGKDQWTFEVSSLKMQQDLAKYGIVQSKTYTVIYPELLEEKYASGFIAGVISGDGSVSLKKNHENGILLRCDIAGNLGLLEPIKRILVKYIGFNKDKKITKYKDAKCLYNLELNQTETINLYNWLKANNISLMKRKNDIIENFLMTK